MENPQVIPKNTTVCVTGATGFIASHLIVMLLKDGYKVRGTVRSTKDTSKYQHLLEASKDDPESLQFFEADLNTSGSFDVAVSGCDFVMHTASPYIINVKDPQKDLVDPALKGTLTVLESCMKEPKVKKVVLTSSLAAITDSPINGKVYSEEDWNKESSLTRNPYYYSKVLAEEAAWNFMKEKKPSFELVVINPFMVIGPELTKAGSVNTSNQILVDIFGGKFPAIMALGWGFVDVRDVAQAHILAMTNPKASGRHLTACVSFTMEALVSKLHTKYPEYHLPSLKLNGCIGTSLVKISSHFQESGVGSYLRTNIGRIITFDNSKVKGLGLNFTDFDITLFDTVDDLIAKGHISKTKK